MEKPNRRHFVKSALLGTGITAFSSWSELSSGQAKEQVSKTNTLSVKQTTGPDKSELPVVLHQTDLFHPHGDPDDHFDLATLYALFYTHKIDLRGIILDYPPDFRKGDPGVVPVAQMNRICGSSVPAVIGADKKMKKRGDSMPELSLSDSAAVQFIIKTLEEAPSPVKMTCVGSATDIAVASLRQPELFRRKCAGVYLDSGSSHPNDKNPAALEFNVRLNPLGYATLFDLPSPLYWYPCWSTTEIRETGPDGTFYWLSHRKSLEGISDSMRHYFQFMFEQSNDLNWLRYFKKPSNTAAWEKILNGQRGMWSTASILHLADLAVTRSGEIVPTKDIEPKDRLYQMTYVDVTCDDAGRTTWTRTDKETNRQMFMLLDPKVYPEAMARGVHSLFASFK